MLTAYRVMVTVMFGGASAFASAQAYPTRPIRLVVPYPAGGGGDLLARPLAQSLTETLGQQVIVENRGGAGGNLGMELAKVRPTAMARAHRPVAVNQALRKCRRPVKDFAPVTLLVRNPYIRWCIRPCGQVGEELIALAQARAGAARVSRQATAARTSAANVKNHGQHQSCVPYKGAAPAITDLIADRYRLFPYRSSGPHVKSGRLRALGVSTANRAPALPDLPAIAETLPGYDLPVWYGVAAPAGTPREIIARLNAEILRTLATPDSRKRMAMDAAEPIGGTPEQFGDYIRSEIVKYAKIVKESGAKID